VVGTDRALGLADPAALFCRQVEVNIRYWRQRVTACGENCRALQSDDENLARAIWLALQLPGLTGQAIALLADLRDFVLRRGDLTSWTVLIEHVVHDVLREHDRECMPEALAGYDLAAELYERRAQPVEAERCLRRALELCADRPMDDRRALALANLGWFLVRRGRGAEGVPCLQQALSAGRALGNLRVQARALLALGAHHSQQEDHAGALVYLTAARPIVEQLHRPNYSGRLWLDMGTLRWQLGEWKSAEACFRLALAYFRKSGDVSLQAGVQVQLGVLHVEREEYREALQQFAAAETIYRRAGNQAELARVYNNLGAAYWGLQAWEEAEYYYQQAVLQWGALDHELHENESLLNLAECYLDQDKLREASAALKQVQHVTAHQAGPAWGRLVHHLAVLQARL
jgi:tetratricopeptide (TPR) repeat protein